MIIDRENKFHSATAVTAAGRYVGDTVDLAVAGDALEGSEATLVITVKTAFASGTNATFTLETHTANDFAAAKTVLWSSGVILTAALVAGYQIQVKVPPGVLQYLAVVATGVGTHDAGTFEAVIAKSSQRNDL
jgi:hypothetical protein